MTLVDELSSGFYSKKPDKSVSPPQVVHEIECVRADTVEQEPILWLWDYRIAQKKLCVFAGPPDTGKTTVVIDIVSRLTRGTDWPDGAAAPYPSDVLMLISEDDLADTIAPRLTVSGVDLTKVHFAMKTIVRDTAERVERQTRGKGSLRGRNKRTRQDCGDGDENKTHVRKYRMKKLLRFSLMARKEAPPTTHL